MTRASFRVLVTVFGSILLLIGMTVWAGGTKENPGSAPSSQVVVPAGKYHEAPMLAAEVAAGKLPPVDRRLPDQPLVAETVNGIGKYGGQLRTFNNDFVPRGMWGVSLFRVPRNGLGNAPNLATGFDISPDRKSMTIHLRPGAKWSDGQPFTSEDIRFMYDDIQNYKPANVVFAWHATSQVTATQVIDKYTIKLICPGGVGILPFLLADWQGTQTNAYQPAHYLKKWDITYNPDADKLAKQDGYDHWYEDMKAHYNWTGSNQDLKEPRMTAWVPVRMNTTTELYSRNPYYWKVDKAGNQLPYIDTAVVQIVSPDVYQLKISSGQADIAWSDTSPDNLSLYKSGEQTNGYHVDLHPGTSGGLVKLDIARTYDDPVLGPIFANLKFRQAVSVAVNRNDINKTLYSGLGVPRQYAPLESASYYKPEWGSYYAQYDPSLANKLLDEMGLNKRDAQGFRLRPDGKTLSIVIEYQTASYTPLLELIRQYWQAVGLKTTIKLEDVGLVEARMNNNKLFAYVHDNINIPWTDERDAFVLIWTWNGDNNAAWFQWFNAKQQYLQDQIGKDKVLPVDWFTEDVPASVEAKFPGVKPPQDYLQFRVNEGKWALTTMGSPEYKQLAQKIFDYLVFNLVRVGYVGEVPTIAVVNDRLGNVPPPGWIKGFPFNDQYVSEWTDQMYIK